MESSTSRLALVLALALAGCSSPAAPPPDGLFTGTVTTPLPSPPLPEGDLVIDATLRLDADRERFDLDMDLSALGLMDEALIEGHYVGANGVLSFDDITFDAATTDTTTQGEDGSACVELDGFVGTVACFADQSSDHTLVNGELHFTLQYVLAGVPQSVEMVLVRQP